MKQSLTIAQSTRYLGLRWWSFSVWIEGPDRDLDAVESVDYFLHPSFRNPQRTRSRREDKFRLTARARGEFSLAATVHRKDGGSEVLRHQLTLEPPEGEPGAPEKPPVAYLTGSATDRSTLNALERALKRKRVSVVTSEKLVADAPDAPFEQILDRVLAPVTSAFVLTTPKPSLWIQREIEQIQKHDIPITVIQIGGQGLPVGFEEIQAIRLEGPDDVGRVASELAAKMKDGG